MNFINKTIKRYKDGILLNWIYQKIKETNFTLYYLVEEGLSDKDTPTIKPKLRPLEIIKLDTSDVVKIAAKGGTHPEKWLLRNLSNGCVCMAIRYKDEIVSYMWYNPLRCDHEHLKFRLKKEEAYLYNAVTSGEYRGKGLAPYLRQEMYKELASLGRTKSYSITEYHNI